MSSSSTFNATVCGGCSSAASSSPHAPPQIALDLCDPEVHNVIRSCGADAETVQPSTDALRVPSCPKSYRMALVWSGTKYDVLPNLVEASHLFLALNVSIHYPPVRSPRSLGLAIYGCRGASRGGRVASPASQSRGCYRNATCPHLGPKYCFSHAACYS